MEQKHYSGWQLVFLLALRLVVGWHFLYEGVVKLLLPDWSAAQYLQVSSWVLAPFFHWIANTPSVLAIVDFINIWGLILIGLGLILGAFTRIATAAGMLILALYYVANPPFVGLDFGIPTEGNYLWVNKILVEFFALGIIAFFPTGHIFGLDVFLGRAKRKEKKKQAEQVLDSRQPGDQVSLARRQLLKGLATLPALGLFAFAFARKKKWQSWEEKNLVDAYTSPTTKLFDPAGLRELKAPIPKAPIKNVDFSRLILGGNLLSGYAHSRDLIYVSSLVRAYHNKDKIFATLLTAEKCGINTLLTNPILCTLIDEYWKRGIGEIKFISDCAGLNYDKGCYAIPFEDYLERIKRAIDYGAVACYIQGETADHYIQNGLEADLEKAIRFIRDNSVILGIGAHRVETLERCVALGFEPDFWMKTLHHHNYWSAHAETWHDNKYCFDPERTTTFIQSVNEPVIAFKTMAAGSIHPQDAFAYAFEHGADFICAGMYDFQIVDDCNIALDILDSPIVAHRQRRWLV
ncbi:DoxX family membrane protein [candidate division KSB1 bacterium]|nr:DoxX family membrane protein [candidate division KSB1 bacterium]RQW03255.1 MAG: DoxX family membrane protein [candidate division KSB1 bacterium]